MPATPDTLAEVQAKGAATSTPSCCAGSASAPRHF